MRRIACYVTLLALFALTEFAGVASAQEEAQQKKPPTTSEAVLVNWEDVGNRLVKMAEDWPEDKYGYRPNADVRTFQQVLLHVAGSNYDLLNQVSGSKLGDNRNDPPVTEYKTKAQVVEFLKKSVADGSREIRKQSDAGVAKRLDYWIGYTEHMGEHYGLLVAYYRNNGVVPPASRPQK
jgi:uncharacterized damage-inducible protein DinB